MSEEKKLRHFILIWVEGRLIGSHTVTQTRWRPFITYLTVKEVMKEHEDQYGSGSVIDVIDVTDPNNIHSAFGENA